MTRRTITYAAQTGKLSSIKLPGRTGHYLLDLDEVRMFAAMQEARNAAANEEQAL